MPDPYDLFLCYSWKDKPTADALVDALRGHRIDGRPMRVFQDDRELQDFDLLTPAVNAALANSRCLAVLYSENLPASAYCRFEIRFALLAAHRLDGTPQRVMAVPHHVPYEFVRPGSLAELRLPDPRSSTRESLVAAIGARVAATGPEVFGDAGEAAEPRWYPQKLVGAAPFHGRDLELLDVYDALRDHRDPGVGGAAVARIVGPGGQGKTMLAEQYARLFADDYPGGVFVLRGFGSHLADSADARFVRSRHADVVTGFADQLELDVTGLDRQARLDAVRDRLAARAEPYLWIVDDLPSGLDRDTFLSVLAPTADGHTLVTSRYRPRHPDDAWGAEVALGGLDPGAAAALLARHLPTTDRAVRRQALALAERLGWHPLALSVSAALVRLPELGGLDGLAEALDAPGPDVLELGERLWGELPSGHRAGIAAAMLRSIAHLNRRGRELLQAVSLLAAGPVPRELLAGMLARTDALEPSVAGERAAQGFAEAAELSLIGAIGVGDTALWLAHTMVLRTARQVDPEESRRDRLRGSAVEELTSTLARGPGGYAGPELAAFLPHVQEVARAMSTPEEWHLVNEAGRVHVELGDSRTALSWYQRLHRACARALGERHETTVTVLAGLGVAHGLLGDHSTALEFKIRAAEGLSAILGENDPAVWTARDNIAVSHSEQGRFDLARDLHRRSYRFRLRLHGPLHPETLTSLSNYAIALGRSGRHAAALRIKREVHRRCVATLGADHPMTADILNNVAADVFALGDRAQAHALLSGVHRLRLRLLGADHADTLTAAENAAVTSAARADAVPLLEDVYRRRLAALGPEHPDTVRVLCSLLDWSAPGPDAGGDPEPDGGTGPEPEPEPADRAVRLGIRFQARCVARYGCDDVRTLTANCLLAHALALQGPGTGALPVVEDAEEGLRQELGSADPATRAALLLRGWIEDVG
jgi:tetratricopeptide (TPR) repeat protein